MTNVCHFSRCVYTSHPIWGVHDRFRLLVCDVNRRTASGRISLGVQSYSHVNRKDRSCWVCWGSIWNQPVLCVRGAVYRALCRLTIVCLIYFWSSHLSVQLLLAIHTVNNSISSISVNVLLCSSDAVGERYQCGDYITK